MIGWHELLDFFCLAHVACSIWRWAKGRIRLRLARESAKWDPTLRQWPSPTIARESWRGVKVPNAWPGAE